MLVFFLSQNTQLFFHIRSMDCPSNSGPFPIFVEDLGICVFFCNVDAISSISSALLPTASLLLLQDSHMATAKPALQPGASSGAAIEQLVERSHVGIWQTKHRYLVSPE